MPPEPPVPERGHAALHVRGVRVRPDGLVRGLHEQRHRAVQRVDAAFGSVAPNGTATEPISINAAEWAQTPALGLMVVSQDNKAGADEADLVKFK